MQKSMILDLIDNNLVTKMPYIDLYIKNKCNYSIIIDLIEKNAIITNDTLNLALVNNYNSCVIHKLLSKGAKILRNTLFLSIEKKASNDIVYTLLDNYESVDNIFNNDILYCAIHNMYDENIIIKLLQKGAKYNGYNILNLCLDTYVYANDEKLITFLVNYGIKITDDTMNYAFYNVSSHAIFHILLNSFDSKLSIDTLKAALTYISDKNLIKKIFEKIYINESVITVIENSRNYTALFSGILLHYRIPSVIIDIIFDYNN